MNRKKMAIGLLLCSFTWAIAACKDDRKAGSVTVRVQNNTEYVLKDLKAYSINFGDLLDGGTSEYKSPPEEGRDPLIQFRIKEQAFTHYIPPNMAEGSHTYKVDSVNFESAMVFVSYHEG